MGALLTSPNRKHRAPLFGSWSLSIRRSLSVRARRRLGGLLLTKVLVRALIHGPAWASSPSSWHQAGQLFKASIHARREVKHRLTACGQRAVCRTNDPSNVFDFTLTPCSITTWRPRTQDSAGRGRALHPNGAARTSALNAGSRSTSVINTWTNQGERRYWTAHLSSIAAPETLIVLGLHSRSRMRT